MEKSTKTTITVISIFLLAGGAFFIYATGRLEDTIAKLKIGKPKNDNDSNVKETKYIPTVVNDFPLKIGKKSSKDKVKIVQEYINMQIWAITYSNKNFIEVDGIFGKNTANALKTYFGIDPIVTETKYNEMRDKVIDIKKKNPNFF